MLSHYNYKDPVVLKTDASRLGIAGILLQQQEGEWRLITCCSRKLDNAEKNYGASELEGLAVIHSVTKLRNYLLGVRFTILTDHCALCAMKKKNINNARLHRWTIILSEYDYEIKYVKGGLHQDVDCLSRMPVDNSRDLYLDDRIIANLQTVEEQRAVEVAVVTPIDHSIWKALLSQDEEAKPHLERARQRKKGYKIYDGCLYYENKIYVPKAKRQEILAEQHADDPACHGGIRATLERMASMWWPTMADDTRDYVKSCRICQARKAERSLPKGSMQSFEIHEPFQLVAFDTLGPLPESIHGNKHVIVGIDCFSRFIDAEAVKDLQMQTFANYLRRFVGRFGTLETILTDNSNFFKNSIVSNIATRLNIEQRYSTPHHHEGNSMVERVIQTLQEKNGVDNTRPNCIDRMGGKFTICRVKYKHDGSCINAILAV